jgi:hypothetical protein
MQHIHLQLDIRVQLGHEVDQLTLVVDHAAHEQGKGTDLGNTQQT